MLTTRPPLGFGLFIPAAGKSLQQLYDEFQMAEDLGFDHAWLPDHLTSPDGPPTDAMHETWTVLTAVAARTSRIRLGPLVSSNTFPSLPPIDPDTLGRHGRPRERRPSGARRRHRLVRG